MGHLNFLSCLIFSFLLKNGRHAPASSRVYLKVSHFLLCSNIRSLSLNSILERSFHSRYNSSCCSPAAAIPGANSNYVLQITQSNKSPATLLQSELQNNQLYYFKRLEAFSWVPLPIRYDSKALRRSHETSYCKAVL